MRRVTALVVFGLLLSGCTSSGLFESSTASSGSSGSSSPGMTDRIARFFSGGGSAKPQQQPGAPPPPEDIDCPSVTVRQGASTLTISNGPPTPLSLRYQGTIGDTARECTISGPTVRMKIGIQGRIILGPAGGPGAIDVPLRIAIVQEGPEPKTIVTKGYRVPVNIEPNAGNVPFVYVEDAMTFPLVSRAEIENYVVYVGFDQAELNKPQKKPVRRSKKPPRRG